MKKTVPAGVASMHPATTGAGVSILERGGNAVDAAVACVLAACAAETVACGFGGGGFATVFTAATGTATCLDFFCAVPGKGGRLPVPMSPVEIRFGEVPLTYYIGGSSIAVPGVPAGCRELSRRFGRLAWADVVAPAVGLAAAGVPISAGMVGALTAIAPAKLRGEGRVAFAPQGRLVRGGEQVFHPGLAEFLARIADGEPFYTGSIADDLIALVRSDGGAMDHGDLAGYEVLETPLSRATIGGRTIAGRDDLNGTLRTARALHNAADLDRPSRTVALAQALKRYAHQPKADRLGETTNLAVVDGDGNACVVTLTLGLGAGLWLPGTGVHLNSVLGEGELMTPALKPGDRVGSMMCPSVAIGPDGDLQLAIGAAGASRIRSALLTTQLRLFLDGDTLGDAIAAPRMHVADDIAHLEPGSSDDEAQALESAGFRVQRWAESNHYFGAVSAVGANGAAADIRRGGHAITL